MAALSRRTFLRASGFGMAASALAGCAQSPAEVAAPKPDWVSLQARLAGRLTLPTDPGYRVAKQAYNPLFDDRAPLAVARCTTPAEVQASLELARTSQIPVAARSGGHSYAGYSTPNNGLIIDVGAMNTVEVRDDGTAVVGAGARMMDIYSALAAKGRCLPAGSCPTVGIAGLTLGGGVGVLTNKYGLTCDRLVCAQVVTADGTLRHASPASEPELFWGLRGGGGGNFGIVTSFVFRTAPAPDPIRFQVRFPAGSAAEVFGGWQQFCRTAPDELWSTLRVSGGTPPICRITGCYVGPPPGLEPLLAQLISATATQPTGQTVAAMSFLEAMRHFGGCTDGALQECWPAWTGSGSVPRESFIATSQVLTAPLAEPAQLTATMHGRNGIELLIDSLGGVAGRVLPNATAFPHRSALAIAQIYSDSTTPESGTAVGEIRSALGTLYGTSGYVNYIDPHMPDWALAYYGSNLPRLHRVAQHYDPDGVFAFAQSLS